jgi:hypothetical protein
MVIYLLNDQKGIGVKTCELFENSKYSNAKFDLDNHGILQGE